MWEALFFLQLSSAAPPAKPVPADSRRTELNLLGKENTAAGEGRRNENIPFNLVDNNALKELNVRLGASATIVEEFHPARSYFGAEFGNAPSAPLAATPAARGGFHGSAFWTHQNSVFSARSFFQAGDVKPARDNRYGFSLSARPWRNGWFSAQAEQDRLRGSVNGNVLAPTPGERTALNPDPRYRAIIERFLAAYPKAPPNRTDINPRALNTNSAQVIDGHDATLRLEQEAGRQRLLASYTHLAQSIDAFQLVAGQNPDTATRSHRARLTWLHSADARTAFTLSAGFDRTGSVLVPEENAVGPMVAVSGLTTLGPNGTVPIDRAQNSYRGEAALRATRGRHEIDAGFALVRRQFNGAETDVHRGFFSFSNDYGRSGIENLRQGTPSQFLGSIGNVWRGWRQTLTAAWLGAKWRAASNVTLTYGLRHEIAARPAEVNHLESVAYGADANNLAPRLGVAWRLPRQWGALRAAAGVQYGDILPVTYSQGRFSPPRNYKLAVPAADLLAPLAGINPARGDGNPNIYALAPELATPYAYQYNLSWELQAGHNLRLQLGYAGSRAHKLLLMWYLNRAHPVPGIATTTATINQRRANPSLAEFRWVVNGSRGYFDAARATLIAPRWRGASIEASYWFSKSLDLGADYTNTAYDADSRLSRSQSEFETQHDRKARSVFDQPHAFLARTGYEMPKRYGGLLFSAVVLLKQGTPFSVTALDGPGFGNVDGGGNDRPDLLDVSVPGRTIGHPDSAPALLPRSAFRTIEPGRESGNLGANVFRKGPIRNLNGSVARSFALRKDLRMTLRAESINVLNTAQFAEPGSVLGTPEFGAITNTLNDGRSLRFSLSFVW